MQTTTRPELSRILDAAVIGVVAADAAGCIVCVNRRAASMLSMEPADAVGDSLFTVLPGIRGPARDCLASGAADGGRHLVQNDRKLIVDLSPIEDGGRVAGLVCCLTDLQVFEQSALQLESIRRLSRQFETVFNSSSDGIWVLDGNGTIVNINRAAEKLIGATADQVIGQRIDTLVEKGLMDRAVTPEVLSSRLQVNLLQYVPATEKYILATGTPVFDENGDISLVVVNERDMTRLNELVERLNETRRKSNQYKEKLAELSLLELKSGTIVAESSQMKQVLKTALKLAQMEVPNILIQGESGTGKGLLAKVIHAHTRREKRPFIEINCAALPETLLEAELFGYEKGAFTGARQKGKAGLFELAQGGTLFLDEIGDIPYGVQAKLLKCLEDHEILHLGGLRPIKIDCIVIAATNQDLVRRVQEKRFRKDLFYRLNAFNICIPPLVERPDDVFELAAFFLEKYNQAYGMRKKISYQAMEALEAYTFPGNVRELKNLVKKAVILSEGAGIDDIILQEIQIDTAAAVDSILNRPPSTARLKDQLQQFEMEILKSALSRYGSTRKMALHLGISQPSVVRKLKKYRL